jgi:ABC-type uncharacterized transport system permease subunit
MLNLIMAIKRPVAYLSLLIFPLAALSIFLVHQFPSYHIIQTIKDPKQFSHILLSIITFSMLLLAGLQAITLAFQEKFLKQKYFQISQILPAIETTEKILFEMIAIGAVFLSLVLVTSLYFFREIMWQSFLQKTILTFMAWLVFTLLLIGRHYFGWRGRKAIYCTLSGVMILTSIYFSGILMMEILP